MSLIATLGAIEIGLVFALVALGVYITFRVLDFPDLTVDGTLPLGAAIGGIGGALLFAVVAIRDAEIMIERQPARQRDR